ncbi:Metal binding domain of Ada (plasmid) [Carboxydocella thermautotrophica]|nr:Metal binding domain of Ada [Carboxydocella thermautotrophica]
MKNLKQTRRYFAAFLMVLFMLIPILNGCSTQSNQPVSSPQQKATYQFVGSVKSNKYHYPTCEWALKIKPDNEIWFTDPKDAQSKGYVPCKVCDPPY